MLTIAFVTGTEPGKWFRRYQGELETVPSDDPFVEDTVLKLMRLPDARVTDRHHVVRLYEEAPGVAVPKDSVFAEVGEPVDPRDLEGEIVNAIFSEQLPIDDLRAALQVVAANVGIAFGPLPLLKNLSRKQVVPLPLVDGAGAATEIALVWEKTADSDEVQDFVGVAKGRTTRSSRSKTQEPKGTLKTAGKDGRKADAQKRSVHKRGVRNHPRSGARKRRS